MTCVKNDDISSFSACVHFLAFPTLKMAIVLNTDKTVIYSRERLWRKWRKIIRGKIAREFWDPTGIIRDSTKRRRAETTKLFAFKCFSDCQNQISASQRSTCQCFDFERSYSQKHLKKFPKHVLLNCSSVHSIRIPI